MGKRGTLLFHNRAGEQPLEAPVLPAQERHAQKQDEPERHQHGGGSSSKLEQSNPDLNADKSATEKANRVDIKLVEKNLTQQPDESKEEWLMRVQHVMGTIGGKNTDSRPDRIVNKIVAKLKNLDADQIPKLYPDFHMKGVTPEKTAEPAGESEVQPVQQPTENVADTRKEKFEPKMSFEEADKLVRSHIDYVKGLGRLPRQRNIRLLREVLGINNERHMDTEQTIQTAIQGLQYGFLDKDFFNSLEKPKEPGLTKAQEKLLKSIFGDPAEKSKEARGEETPEARLAPRMEKPTVGNRGSELRNKLEALKKKDLNQPQIQRDYLRNYAELVSLYEPRAQSGDPDARLKLENIHAKYLSTANRIRQQMEDRWGVMEMQAPKPLPNRGDIRGLEALLRNGSSLGEKLYAANSLASHFEYWSENDRNVKARPIHKKASEEYQKVAKELSDLIFKPAIEEEKVKARQQDLEQLKQRSTKIQAQWEKENPEEAWPKKGLTPYEEAVADELGKENFKGRMRSWLNGGPRGKVQDLGERRTPEEQAEFERQMEERRRAMREQASEQSESSQETPEQELRREIERIIDAKLDAEMDRIGMTAEEKQYTKDNDPFFNRKRQEIIDRKFEQYKDQL